jgi:aminoglycoside/choline kinase family phosphotransferase
MAAFVAAFLEDAGLPAEEFEWQSLPGDGSKRIFWRISISRTHATYIAMENAPTDDFSRRENFSYLMIGRHLYQKGLPIPELHRFNLKKGCFIMEDMGDNNLQNAASLSTDRIGLYERVIEILFRLQIEGSEGFDTKWCCQTEKYDSFVMRRYEADYFVNSFLGQYLGLKKDWPELVRPFRYLAETASRADSHFFLHRDFQSRNIMVSEEKMGILDWQGGRLGPLAYDLSSLLIDPYTNLSIHEKDRIYQHYLRLLADHRPGWADPFKRYFPYLAIQRNLQILGAFSYLSRVRKKTYFEAYISPALNTLCGLLDDLGDPKLSPLTDILISLPNFRRA